MSHDGLEFLKQAAFRRGFQKKAIIGKKILTSLGNSLNSQSKMFGLVPEMENPEGLDPVDIMRFNSPYLPLLAGAVGAGAGPLHTSDEDYWEGRGPGSQALHGAGMGLGTGLGALVGSYGANALLHTIAPKIPWYGKLIGADKQLEKMHLLATTGGLGVGGLLGWLLSKKVLEGPNTKALRRAGEHQNVHLRF